jgi:hypothetical protein
MPKKVSNEFKKIDEHIIDKTKIKKVSALTWIWVAIIKPKDKEILSISMSKERNMFV